MMTRMMFFLALSMTNVLAFTPSFTSPKLAARPSSTPVVAQMNFFDDLQKQFSKMMAAPPTLGEAFEMCRDDESSGCTVEMLELIEKDQNDAVMREIMDTRSPRWSKDIDEAVVKPE